ncbi:MAG: hypothetical protein HFJ52_00465 [Clostridia bacterium]|nr:hypothetical protein [Clostridia bacterium]
MKNKGYFCDWYDKHQRLLILIIAVVLFVIFVGVASLVVGKEYKSKLETGCYVYDVETYEQLEEVIDNCVYEDGMIDIQTLLQATDTEINFYEETFQIVCSSKEKSIEEYDYIPEVTVTISNDFSTFSRKRMHPTEEAYLEGIKISIYLNTFVMFVAIYIVALLIMGATIECACAVSKIKKRKNFL